MRMLLADCHCQKFQVPVPGETISKFIKQGWPSKCSEAELQPYFQRRDELSVQDDCILWGNQVVLPPQGRSQVMEELHETHLGIRKMKSLARSYAWWPKMDKDLEIRVQTCANCQMNRKNPWEWPMGEDPHRLCWSISGENVPGNDRRIV